MLIRTEVPSDILSIDALLKEVFDTPAEAELVMALREQGQRTLSLVASSDEGDVIGHIFFSPVTVDGQDNGWQGLAPLCVKQDYRGQGIGQTLMQEATEILAELGYPVVVVLGDSQYYHKAGFVTAAEHGLHCSWPVPEESFMVQELLPDSLNGHQGLVAYSAPFSALS
ncbi:GNAT family N-acetyltransferase [Photobacterium galatheae]|uniref:Acetyltransferase n=1 Tax=Photobacterium galatheae TaxID=1654360 RepID=A0A066RNA7_9GAMM|nr:N-acetyltransferase [Photobacterium galatheae]KDM91834.1 acetyltransferase [Photobacterium galatheae]MCM0147757.1 N-acetyltransferase [Photobacterium galatheae]